MGLSFYGMKDLSDNIPYSMFYSMRVLVATKIDDELANLYQQIIMPPNGDQEHKGMYLKMFREKENELNVPRAIEKFLFQCDCSSNGEFDKNDTKKIYDYFVANDLFNKCRSEDEYYEEPFNDLENALKYCAENGMEFFWM